MKAALPAPRAAAWRRLRGGLAVLIASIGACGAGSRSIPQTPPALPPLEPRPTAQETLPMQSSKPTNRLARETSPYLLQHAHNPVDWHPWGKEAFERAKREDKPIFLSIGYSACHWCHVMERECFENEAIAAVMNELFVNVKVDREERPDVDEIYMKAVQILTRGGGWPMSVWLTPEGKPFYGGTYFPPEDRQGRAGFPRVCKEMARLWKDERERVTTAAGSLTQEVQRIVLPAPGSAGEVPADALERATEQLLLAFDETFGGFGQAPKFPHPMDLALLVRVHARFGNKQALHAAEFTLQRMAAGGIYDQLGDGFHRYSTDERWLVPHFEKMLYDNALLLGAYVDAWQGTGDAQYAEVARGILRYLEREMYAAQEGAFYSTQDADSEGVEGKYFAWDPAEIQAVLGDEAGGRVAQFFGVSVDGNFEEGKSVLSRPWSVADFAVAKGMAAMDVAAQLVDAREKLLAVRARRVAPARDDKILADWNGLLISALARAGVLPGAAADVERGPVARARGAARFIRAKLWAGDGDRRLRHSWKDGQARHEGMLADYAFVAEGLIDLYQATFEVEWLAFARELVDASVARFWDGKEGGFFATAHDDEPLIARSKDAYDGAIPSGPSVQVMNLLRLAELTGDAGLRDKATRTLALYRPQLEQQPLALSRMLAAVDFLQSAPREIVLVAERAGDLAPFLELLRRRYDPNRVVLVVTPDTRAALDKLSALTVGKVALGGRLTAYLCRDGACKLPITDLAEFERALAGNE